MDISKMAQRPSNHEKAVQQLRLRRIEGALTCPACHAMNRPGTTYIELDETGTAWCSVCSHNFAVNIYEEEPRT